MSKQTETKNAKGKKTFEMIDELLKGGEKTGGAVVALATKNPEKLFAYINVKGLEIESALMQIRTASITLARALTIYLEKNEV